MDITNLKIRDMRKLLDSKEISAAELACSYIDRIEKYDGKLESYITVTKEKALLDAENAQKRIDSGNAPELCGIPIAVKDNICTDGIKTTCASKMLENFIPPYNATVMEKLYSKGIVLLGKTSMDGRLDANLGFCQNKKSLRYKKGSGRLVGRLRLLRISLIMRGFARLGYRRFYKTACVILRRNGLKAYLRPSITIRSDSFCIFA